jgi:hypothetical protein
VGGKKSESWGLTRAPHLVKLDFRSGEQRTNDHWHIGDARSAFNFLRTHFLGRLPEVGFFFGITSNNHIWAARTLKLLVFKQVAVSFELLRTIFFCLMSVEPRTGRDSHILCYVRTFMFANQEPNKKADHLQFTKLALDPGKSVIGWKSGPHVGLHTHHLGYTKPCVNDITLGKLPCKGCTAQIGKGWCGWMPFFDDVGERWVVMFGKSALENVKRLPFGCPIRVTKGRAKNKPYRIVAEQWTTVSCPFIGRLRFQHDIQPWLLQLWKMPELTAHFGMEPQEIEITASESEVLYTSGKRWKPEMRLEAIFDNEKPPVTPDPPDRRVEKHKLNGKPH